MSDAGPNEGGGNSNGQGNGNRFESTTLNRLLRVLADQRRRTVLYALADRNGDVISLDELADLISGYDLEFEDEERTRLILHHRDLPKLEEANLLEYDSRNETIRYRGDGAAEELSETLENLEKGPSQGEFGSTE